MSVLASCSSYRESIRSSKERQGPTVGVRSVLPMCPSYRASNKGSKEGQGPTLAVRFSEVSVL